MSVSDLMKPHTFQQEHRCGTCGNGGRCDICSHEFRIGDIRRLVCMNDRSPSPGNFWICAKCDHADIVDEMRIALICTPDTLANFALAYRLWKAEQRYAKLEKLIEKGLARVVREIANGAT